MNENNSNIFQIKHVFFNKRIKESEVCLHLQRSWEDEEKTIALCVECIVWLNAIVRKMSRKKTIY